MNNSPEAIEQMRDLFPTGLQGSSQNCAAPKLMLLITPCPLPSEVQGDGLIDTY